MLKIAQAGVLFVAASAFGTIVAPACAFAEEVVVHGEHHGDSGHGQLAAGVFEGPVAVSQKGHVRQQDPEAAIGIGSEPDGARGRDEAGGIFDEAVVEAVETHESGVGADP